MTDHTVKWFNYFHGLANFSLWTSAIIFLVLAMIVVDLLVSDSSLTLLFILTITNRSFEVVVHCSLLVLP